MFEIGFSEILVIMAIALVVLGPEKLPRLAAQVGRWVGRAKAMARQFREQLEDEANKLDVAKDLKKNFDLVMQNDPPRAAQSEPPPVEPAVAGEPDHVPHATDAAAVDTPHETPATHEVHTSTVADFHPEPLAEASVDSTHERRH